MPSIVIKIKNGKKEIKGTLSTLEGVSLNNKEGEEEVFITYRKNPLFFWRKPEIRFLFNPKNNEQYLRLMTVDSSSIVEAAKAYDDYDKLFNF